MNRQWLKTGVLLAVLASGFGCGTNNNLKRTSSTETNPPVTSVPQVVVVSSDKLYNFLEDTNTGVLTAASGSPLVLNPGMTKQCATSPANNFLMVTRNTNTLLSFKLDGQTGYVTPGSSVSTGGFPIATAEVGGTLIYVATTSTQNQVLVPNVVGFRIDPISGSLQSLGVIEQDALWEPMIAHPSGRFLYAVDEVGRVLTFGIDQNTAALTPVTAGALPTTYTSSQQFAFTPDGSYMFASGSVLSPPLQPTPAMFVFQVNTSSGALTLVAGSPFTLPLAPLAFVMHPNGKFIYAITGNSVLTAFGVDSAFALHTVNTVSVPSLATALSFDRAGSFLFVLSKASSGTSGADELTTYKVDGATGMLHPVGAPYPVPNDAACVLTR